MAATLDKDTIVKHSFWVLAGGYVVLVLACLVVLKTSVGDTVRKEKEDMEKAEAVVKGINDPKNQSFVDAYKKQDEVVDKKKDEVWGKAWETQKDMMTWPRDLQADFQKKYKYFGDPIDPFDRNKFDGQYASQEEEVWQVVQPVMPNGEGVVQCKGDWAEVLQLDRSFPQKPPTKDDIWLAQEDLWIKREMLRIIRDANQSVARFKEVGAEPPAEPNSQPVKAQASADKNAKAAASTSEPEAQARAVPPAGGGPKNKDAKGAKPTAPAPAAAAPKSDPNHKVLKNPNWTLALALVGPEGGKYFLRGKLINSGKRKQSLDTKFKVFLQDPRTVNDPSGVVLSPTGLPLAVGESKAINEPVPEQNAIDGLFGAEQILDWRTAAVKRLDVLQLMYPSSRTAAKMLKPPRFLAEKPSGDSGDSSGDAGDAAPGQPAGGTPLPGAAAGPATATLNGLTINRYTDVSDQVRHMPVAMVVVVDEEHLPELLAAFVNSKLRIQITQYHWQHCREPMNPRNAGDETPPPFIPGGGREPRAGPGFVPSPGRSPPGTIGGQKYAANNPLLGRGGASGFVPGMRPRGPAYGPPRPHATGVGAPGPIRSGPIGGPGFRPATPGITGDQEEEQEDLNLLEVAVYGLASLYERYPPAPPKPADQGTTEDKSAAGSTGGN
jgi:hypothetical protein